MHRPAIASYVADFLKIDQNHVYRQLTGLRDELDMHVFTHKRAYSEHFPYHEKWLHVLPKPRLRWWRRFIYKTLKDAPWPIFRWELRQWILDLVRIDAKLLHIYFGHVAPQFIPLMKAWPKPVVVSYHGADAGVDMNKPNYHLAQQAIFHHAAQIQCRSEALLQDLLQLGCPKEKIVIQRTGIPVEFWTKASRQAPEDGAWVLCQSCRFIEKKGIDLTLNAFAQLRRAWPKAKLILCGSGPLKETLQQLAQSLGIAGAVEFPGFRTGTHMLQILHEAHLYLHPSRTSKDGNREGIPNAMLEAMATGLPTIATTHGGIPEAIQDGVNGLLVPEDDALALANAMQQLLTQHTLREQLGTQAHLSITEKFSSVAQAKNLLANYQRIMK
jgi:colanic acid/amylovoran biosynthesis glycosyltransferase